MIERFGDAERGGFFTTSTDHEELIARRKEVGDHPIPAGQSHAALGLLRLAALSGEARFADRAAGVFALFGEPMISHPDSFAHLLRALDFHLASKREVALVGQDTSAARGDRPGRVPPQRRRRRRPGGRGRTTAPRRPHRNRRRARRLRLRGLRLQPAGDRPRPR